MIVPTPDPQDFVYFDGLKQVYGDRLAMYKKICRMTRGHPNELHRKVYGTNASSATPEDVLESLEACEQLVALVREVFQMQPHDRLTNKGAREEHCLAVWGAFVESMYTSKKKSASSQTFSTATESPPASSPISTPGSV